MPDKYPDAVPVILVDEGKEVYAAKTASTTTATTATVAQVNTSTASTTLAAANNNRKQVVIYNNATVNLLVKFGSTASATSFTTQVLPSGTLIVGRETYTGVIDGLLASGSASTAQITVTI